MKPLSRLLHKQASQAAVSTHLTANASVRNLTTQCRFNWCSNSSTSSSSSDITTARQSRQNNASRTIPIPSSTPRAFSTTSILSKANQSKKKSQNEDEIDPTDMTEMEAKIKKAVDKFKDKVSSVRTGGRFNPQSIESVRVVADKNSKETVRLGDLAQVIPKGGRMVAILAGDEEYLKPISSALTTSQFSLNPQTDPRNALQLNVPIPPPTKESREADLRDVKEAMDTAAKEVRSARMDQNQKLKKNTTIRPDDQHRALKKMDNIAGTGQSDLKKVLDSVNKAIEQQ